MKDNEAQSKTTRETEQRRLGGFFARGGFPRVAPHDESAACREAWLQGYDEAQENAPKPVYCPYTSRVCGIKTKCETPNACAGGISCRFQAVNALTKPQDSPG